METVAQIIERYNISKKYKYHSIQLAIKKDGLVVQFETYNDVSDICFVKLNDDPKYNEMVCFYGKNVGSDIERYIRINNADIIRSEV